MFDLLKHGVKKGEELGGEFVEARFDDLMVRELRAEKRVVKDIKSFRRRGIGVNLYYGGATGYSFTVDLSRQAVTKTVARAMKIAEASSGAAGIEVEPGEAPTSKSKKLELRVKKHPRDFQLGFKKDLMLRAVDSAQEQGQKISSITGRYGEFYGEKLFLNSAGTRVSWHPLVVDLRLRVVSKEGDLLVDGADAFGGSF
ncbi:hypothetical protein GWN63_03205, partial [Candidatus Bathyarchaeota archaeon]|nr:hypothetical protein [Candidatus Bathyarchaeota archaeon]NIV67887.1 hypothetical protein [Candidatus Bathyarchaeota archaeon]NIW34475.1 hypothetical protein [Candidatus Bathyarchaeota archaeon]